MRRTINIIGLLTMLFLALPFASASLTNGMTAYYEFDDLTDSHASYDLTNYGATSGATGFFGNAYDYDAPNDYMSPGDYFDVGTGDFTFSVWMKPQTLPAAGFIYLAKGDQSTGTGGIYDLRVHSDDKPWARLYDSGWNDVTSSTTVSAGTWYHMVMVRSGGTLYFYRDGVSQGSVSASGSVNQSRIFTIGARDNAGTYDAGCDCIIDELGVWVGTALNSTSVSALYNSGSGLSYSQMTGGAAPGTAGEALPQTSYAEQTSNTTINSVSYVPVLSSSVTLDNSTDLFATATIPIYNPAASNTATCQVTFNGTVLTNSETARTLTAGAAANILIHSNAVNYPAGTYDLELQCKRTGGGAYTIAGSNVLLHQMTTTTGESINYNETNQSSVSISGVPASFSLTTTGNQSDTGLTRAIYASYTTAIDYTATQNVTLTLEVGGTNCTSLIRYGTNGALGSVGDSCFTTGLTNSTAYDVKVHGSGSGTLEGLSLVAREIILHTNEINSTNLSGITMNNTAYEALASYNISVDAGHSTPNLASFAALSFQGTNESSTGSFYLSDGTTNSTVVSRTSGAGEPGVIGIQLLSESVTGVVTLTLFGLCDNGNCSLTGSQSASHLSDDNPATPNSFNVSVYNQYTDSYENNFDIAIGNVTYSTSTGLIEVFTSDSLVNVTFPNTNNTAPVYFANNTENHNTDGNLTINATTWTSVYAVEPDSDTVYNFTIDWIDLNNTAHNGSYTTTTGVAYVPVYNSSWQLNITNAVGEDGTAYAIDTYESNVSQYLQNYTFNLLIANSVNISYYDEETGLLIDFTNVTLEYFSTDGTSGNSSTSTGVMFVPLLLPETYTFIYDAPGYDERFYEFTLVNETFNNLNLTLLNSSSSSTVTITVKDTLDNLLENAVVKIMKFDVADNEYDLIEVRRTNFEGQTIASLVLNSPLYKFIVEYDGRVVLTTTGTQIYGTDLTLIVNLVQSTGFEEVFTSYSMSGDVTFSNTTNLFTFTFNDESNTGQEACLNVYRITDTRTLYNQSCSSTTSGTLTAWVTNVSGRTYQGVGVITDSNGFEYVIDSEWAVFKQRLSDDGSSLIMMILMIIIFATALAVSVEIAIVGAFTVPLIFTATGLTALGYGVTVPLMVLGIVVAFILGVVRR